MAPCMDGFLVRLALPRFLVVNAATISVAVVLPVYVGYRESSGYNSASDK